MQCKLIQQLNLCVWTILSLQINYKEHVQEAQTMTCKLIAVKVLHTSLLNTTMVAFTVLPLGSYAPMPVPSPPFKTILELVLWTGLQSGRCTTTDVIKMPSFQYFLYLREQKKVTWG